MNYFFYSPMHLNNLGTNIRSLECFGKKEAFVFDEFNLAEDKSSWGKERHRRFKNFSAGAFDAVKLKFVSDPVAFFKSWQGRIIATIASHPQGKLLWEFEFEESDLMIIGSESHGLQPQILEVCTDFLSIPQYGKTNSLNVSTATSILLYEEARQNALNQIWEK